MYSQILENITKDKSRHGLDKFKFYFEDVAEDNKVFRPVTRADRAWAWAYRTGFNIISAARTLLRAVRQMT